MSDLNIEELIYRQLKNDLSKDERDLLFAWYEASDTNKKLYADYCVLFKSREIEVARSFFEQNKERGWARLSVRLHSERLLNGKFIRAIGRYAAVALIAFFIGGATLWLLQPQPESLAQRIEVPLGSKSRVTLPDGSQVWLNSGSVLSYYNGFGKKNRSLTLEGEGCFDVVSNKSLPFEVFSGDVKIKVLGTKFNMKSYSDDETTKVTLIEGSLNISSCTDNRHSKTIVPNQQAIIDKRSRRLSVKKVDAFNYALWTKPKKEIVAQKHIVRDEKLPDLVVPNTTLRNILFFDEEPLNQIIRDLERAFNVSIELKESNIGAQRFYGDFRNDETIYEILDIITQNSNLKYEIQDRKIIISK